MSKYKFVKQSNEMDCGAACLSMIIKAYKGNVSLETLSELSETNVHGTTFSKMIKASHLIGLSASGYETSIEDLEINKLPAIVQIKLDHMHHHFLVVFKINHKRKKIVVGDPRTNISSQSFEEFNKQFTGKALFFEPYMKLINNNDSGVTTLLKEIINKKKSLLIFISGLSIFLSILAIINSFHFKVLLDRFLTTKSQDNFLLITFIFLVLNGLLFLFGLVKNYYSIILSNRVEFFLKSNLYSKLFNLPHQSFKNKRTGDIINRFNDIFYIKILFGNIINSLSTDLVVFIFGMLVLFFINIGLAILTISYVVTSFLIVFLFYKKQRKLLSSVVEAESKVSNYLIEGINNYETIYGLKNNTKHINNYKKKLFDNLEKSISYEKFHLFKNSILNFNTILVNFFLLTIGFYMVSNGLITLGSLITFLFIISLIQKLITSIVIWSDEYEEAASALRRVNEIFYFETDKTRTEFNYYLPLEKLS